MVTEQDKTLEAVQIAIQMEIDGKKYYLKASRESSNELAKKLLQSLAAEEDLHLQKFEEIYDAIRSKKAWPETDFKFGGSKNLKHEFARVIKEIGPDEKSPATELDAIQIAINMESKSYDFYKKRSKLATSDTERDYYEAVAAEEREHHLVLLDYYEYFSDPAGWFVKREHPSMDGG